MNPLFKMDDMVTIDDLYKNTLKRLSDNGEIGPISYRLMQHRDFDSCVHFVKDILSADQVYPRYVDVKKCVDSSETFRNLGNVEFKNRNQFDAYQFYNMALLHAPSGSSVEALAVANRSAALFSMMQYEQCLIDIGKVESMNCPEETLKKVAARKKACETNIYKGGNTKIAKQKYWKTLMDASIKTDHSKTIPCAGDSVEIKHDKDFGRHVVATRDIDVGEIICYEKPFVTLLLKSQYLVRCYYCLGIDSNLIPCDGCCFVMFCSETCKQKASVDYHRFECPIMPILISMDFTKLELLALKTVIKAKSEHTDWREFICKLDDISGDQEEERRGFVRISRDYSVYDSKFYKCVHTLATNFERRSASDIFQKAVTAAVLLHLLTEHTPIVDEGLHDESRELVMDKLGGLLLLHLMTCPTNMHSISPLIASREGEYLDDISVGSGAYAFLSLLNHSCSPNVVRLSDGTNKALVCLRPIKKGMQLLDNYGFHHATQTRKERRSGLSFQYKFMCVCEACLNEWPVYIFLRGASNLSPEQRRIVRDNPIDEATMVSLKRGDVKLAIKKYKGYCAVASALENKTPCKEVADYQESIKQCLSLIIERTVPHCHANLIEWFEPGKLSKHFKS